MQTRDEIYNVFLLYNNYLRLESAVVGSDCVAKGLDGGLDE